MNSSLLSLATRNFLTSIEININHLRGREFIPTRPDMLHIETSSACNLKCCFCAYTKKQSPRVSMQDEFFKECVRQALDLRYRRFELTPCTGDVFMDRHIFNKLEFLDAAPQVQGYQFFTNFTVPRRKDIERLVALEKLNFLTISIYGHNPETFTAITKSGEKLYRRLVSNLETLYSMLDRKRFSLSLEVRTPRRLSKCGASELTAMLDRFRGAGIPVGQPIGHYNNWGGYVTQDDVKGLPIDITSADAIYKKGACIRLLLQVQIMATGIVNGCACRDVDATLAIGDLNERPLRDILSSRNPLYMNLIEEQQKGEFRPVCRSCDFYVSVYHKRSSYRKDGTRLQSIQEFKAELDKAPL